MVKQERAARTRESLIQAAAEVFAEDGYGPASLTTISKKAGVSNGALHFHFPSKAALAQAVEDEALRTLSWITEEVAKAGLGALQELVDATYRLMDSVAEDTVVRAGFELCGDIARGDDAELRRTWQRWVEDTLLRAERDGQLADEVSAEVAAPAVVAATIGFEVLGGRDREWLSERRLAHFWQLLLPRLAGRRALAATRTTPG